MTISMDGDNLRQLYRLLSDKLAVGDVDAIDFLTWLDGEIGKAKS